MRCLRSSIVFEQAGLAGHTHMDWCVWLVLVTSVRFINVRCAEALPVGSETQRTIGRYRCSDEDVSSLT